ncbi:hypothetical protein Pmani_032291 [Petrolisthes manimaculis]|uniref:Uncharacterized protein n=1 Tax=Petrolisthes manimaculis TaxID=1843537 RepID=A0AAE1NS03_9EUCA|nr:hypothetical protein Pmani_038068 [Petrolisthes manimaculis]KAK4295134.1 hypothetical protein Pmani_032291 [Petrolisthes manimaculis]
MSDQLSSPSICHHASPLHRRRPNKTQIRLGRTAKVTPHTIRPETVVTSNLRLHPEEGLLDLLLVTTQLWTIYPPHLTTRIPPICSPHNTHPSHLPTSTHNTHPSHLPTSPHHTHPSHLPTSPHNTHPSLSVVPTTSSQHIRKKL